MPIKRLQQNAKFPTIGKLRKGGESVEKTNAKGEKYNSYGKELDYWRFVPNNGILGLGAAFDRIFGQQPKNIEVLLPYDTTDECFDCWQEQWSKSSLLHRCDGETTVLIQENGKYLNVSKPCPGGCKEVGRLSVIIPALCREIGYIGSVTMETHSLHDIMNISAALMAYEDMRGSLKGGSFMLSRYPEMISTPNPKTGKRARREKWLVRLTPTADWLDNTSYLPPSENVPALPASVNEDTGEITPYIDLSYLAQTGKEVLGDDWKSYAKQWQEENGIDVPATQLTPEQLWELNDYLVDVANEKIEAQQQPLLPVADEVTGNNYNEPDF